jgi:CheY-like chemotaxis protein
LPRLAQGLVLVVDDDADLRELLRFQLELGGSEVIEATNAEEALALARVRRPQVALIDLALPTMGGLALAERMRTDPERSKIRLIAMSGYGGSEARRRSAEVGFAEHLVKPITLEELERALSAGEPRG